MPARFVEVSNPLHAARNSDPLAYVQTMRWDVSAWGGSTFDTWTGVSNSTNTSSFKTALYRTTTVLSKIRAPEGPARWMLYAAAVLMVMRWALLRRVARRAVVEYGHAHAE